MLIPSAVIAKPLTGSIQEFTSYVPGSSSWIVPEDVTLLDSIEIWGGGAAGGRSTVQASGGGAGGYSRKNNISVTPSQSISFTIGYGGAAQNGLGVGNNGTATTTEGMTANGGLGGYTETGGLGGAATGGDINTSGGNGQNATFLVQARGGNSPNGGNGGNGGNPGQNGQTPGGGGGGRAFSVENLNGAGAPGGIRIRWNG